MAMGKLFGNILEELKFYLEEGKPYPRKMAKMKKPMFIHQPKN